MTIISNSVIASNERAINLEVTVDCTLENVWDAWTTEDGVETFFSPDCKIELEADGAYEMYFNPNEPLGKRGGEGNKILAIQKHKMFSFTWNSPTHLPDVRNQRTHVTLRFEQISEKSTKVILHHDGWGIGGQWDEAYNYFKSAWGDVVLPRLKYRFDSGPIDWDNPPTFEK